MFFSVNWGKNGFKLLLTQAEAIKLSSLSLRGLEHLSDKETLRPVAVEAGEKQTEKQPS